MADDVAKLCAAGINLRGIGVDFYRLLDGTDFECEVRAVFLIDVDLDASLRGLLKTGSFHLHRVVLANWNTEKLVGSARVGLHSPNHTSV